MMHVRTYIAAILLAGAAVVLAVAASAAHAQSRAVTVGVYQNAPKIHVDESGWAAGIFADLLNDIAARRWSRMPTGWPI